MGLPTGFNSMKGSYVPQYHSNLVIKGRGIKTRPSALGMSDPIWGPLIHIIVDEKKKCEGQSLQPPIFYSEILSEI